METGRFDYEEIITGYKEYDVEHKDNEGNLLYTEHIKEPIKEIKETWVKYTQQELYANELYDLMKWFDEYDLQVKQYNRCQRLGVEFDKDIKELDDLAVVNAKRIKELREFIKNTIGDVCQ